MSTLSIFPEAHTFIETGYGRGDTLAGAVEYPYQRIVSIEVDPTVAAAARAAWSNNPRVEIVEGDSAEMLPHVIDPTKSTVFWLDAHYSGGGWPSDERIHDRPQCPLLGELRAIANARWQKTSPTIIVDDAEMFGDQFWQTSAAALFRREDWPTLSQIEALGFHVDGNDYLLFLWLQGALV